VGGKEATMSKLRVYLAEDHAIVREGLKMLLSAQPDMEIVGEAADGRTALEQATLICADVVITDVSMPELGGAELTEGLRRACPQTKVVALTVHEDKGYLRRLLEAGAAGYVLKRSAADELVRAVRAVAAGGTYLDPTLAGRLADEFVGRRAGPTAPLSPREEEVARLIAMGYTNKEIAAQLRVGVKSVETYKSRALEKLALDSRADLVRYALSRGWLGQT
jgi:DNA-binding NarL/FixJ family response regulator